jgi:hypothetical protein
MLVSHYSKIAVGAIRNANQLVGLLILGFYVVSMASTYFDDFLQEIGEKTLCIA